VDGKAWLISGMSCRDEQHFPAVKVSVVVLALLRQFGFASRAAC
jgi:hypothetical protein